MKKLRGGNISDLLTPISDRNPIGVSVGSIFRQILPPQKGRRRADGEGPCEGRPEQGLGGRPPAEPMTLWLGRNGKG